MRAVHLLRHEHAIITLCRVLNVNRSSYYKHFNSKEPKRAIENRNIKNCILQIYSEAKCRYGAQKMRKVLEVNYGIHISQGRVYRLMKQMQLPKMSTVKPKFKAANKSSDRDCHNILKQNFNPKEPNKAWCSDITYIKAGGRFYMVHRPFRLAEILTAMCEAKLEPKRMRLVYPYVDKEPNMVLIEGIRGAKSRMTVDPPLIVYEKDGSYTREILEYYGMTGTGKE